MESLNELSFDEMVDIDGGEPISILLGAAALAITVGTVAVYVYNNAGDIVDGFNDGRSGNYTGPKCTC